MSKVSSHQKWALFRYSVISPVLSRPPQKGELKERLQELCTKEWEHSISGQPLFLGYSTLERWYYRIKDEQDDPIGKLRRSTRSDLGKHRRLKEELIEALEVQYQAHPGWSYQLHYDNLKALSDKQPCLGVVPSYNCLRIYMKSRGWTKSRSVPVWRRTEGTDKAMEYLNGYQRRSYQAEYVNELWHLDFHKGSLPVVNAQGHWERPLLLVIMDDCSRLACHGQWYFQETAQVLIHGLMQAFLKRGIPRALLTDNGSAMIAHETTEGLERLGLKHERTLPYSPYQNGKQESFWGHVEGRLLAMLEDQSALSLATLNKITQAYLELEYNRKEHRETKGKPIEIYANGKDVGLSCPKLEELEQSFTRSIHRKQRKGDGTLSIEGIRFEIPSRYRHIERFALRYCSWDLSKAYILELRQEQILCTIYPQDKILNANTKRKRLEPIQSLSEAPEQLDLSSPLLSKLLEEQHNTGLPAAYLKF